MRLSLLLILVLACIPVPSLAEEPEYGGRIVEPMLGRITNLIPQLATDAGSHAVASYIYVSPLKYDKNIELVPYAAESFEVLDGGKHLKFVLRDDIRWTDGEPLTADDVEFTYRLMTDPDTPTAYASDWNAIKEFRKTGRYSFEVFYEKPFARSLVTWASEILPKHLLEGEDLVKTELARKPVGAGPYKLKEWLPGQHVTLEANDDFFDGRPYIDEVHYRIISDISTQFLELKAGNLDYMGLTPLQYLRQTTGKRWDSSFNKFKYLSFGYTYLGFNLRHPFFKDKTVRRALSYAIDKEEIVKGVLFGLGVPAIGPYKPGTWQYNEDIRDYGYDPDKALRMLAEAGWTDSDGDGWLDREGRPFWFTIITNQGNSQRAKCAVIMQRRLKDIGIKVDIRTIEWSSFIAEFVKKGRFDAVILSWNILQDPDLFNVWHSSQAENGGLNFVNYKNAELDELLIEGQRSLDQARRQKIYHRAQEILHEDQPYVFLYIPYSLPIISARIHGVEPAPAGISHNFIRWWIPKTMQMRKQ